MDVRAKSPVHLELRVHTALLRGQGLEIKKKDIKQQDFNVLTPQSLPAIWLLHRPGAYTCVHTLAHLFHGTSLFQFHFCLCVATQPAVVYNPSNLLNLSWEMGEILITKNNVVFFKKK